MDLKVVSYDKPAMEDLFKIFADNRNMQIADAIEIEFKGIGFKKGIDFPQVAAFVITVGSHIPAALAADIIKDWLVPRFHKRCETITVNEEEFVFKRGKLRKIVRPTIKHERR